MLSEMLLGDNGHIMDEKEVSSSSLEGLTNEIISNLIATSNPPAVELSYKTSEQEKHKSLISLDDFSAMVEEIKKYNNFGGKYVIFNDFNITNGFNDPDSIESSSSSEVISPLKILPSNSSGEYFKLSPIKNRKLSFKYKLIKAKNAVASFYFSKGIVRKVPKPIKEYLRAKLKKNHIQMCNLMDNCYHTTLTKYVQKP